MKKRALEITNGLLLVSLTSIDILLILKFELTNDCWLLIALALFCFIIYLLGKIFPHYTVTVIYKLSRKIYKKSDDVSIPIIDEARKTFENRLPYLLTIVNILMLLLMLIILLN